MTLTFFLELQAVKGVRHQPGVVNGKFCILDNRTSSKDAPCLGIDRQQDEIFLSEWKNGIHIRIVRFVGSRESRDCLQNVLPKRSLDSSDSGQPEKQG